MDYSNWLNNSLYLPFGDNRQVSPMCQSSDKDHSVRKEPIAPETGFVETKIEKLSYFYSENPN